MKKQRYLFADEWLSNILGRNAYRLEAAKGWAEWVKKPGSLKGLAKPGKKAFVYAKRPPTDVAGIALLENAGFRLVDTNLRFEKKIGQRRRFGGKFEVRFATPADELAVARVARKGFSRSRFHLDPAIGKRTADRLKAEWARNYFTHGRGDHMIVALKQGKVVGFNQLLESTDGNLVIDLIAVDPAYRRKGIARDLVAFAEMRIPGFDRIIAGTQLANGESSAFYESMGFSLKDAQQVFHRHS